MQMFLFHAQLSPAQLQLLPPQGAAKMDGAVWEAGARRHWGTEAARRGPVELYAPLTAWQKDILLCANATESWQRKWRKFLHSLVFYIRVLKWAEEGEGPSPPAP